LMNQVPMTHPWLINQVPMTHLWLMNQVPMTHLWLMNQVRIRTIILGITYHSCNCRPFLV
jgi:hypothetical protein